jgi:hypothetical protein
MRVIVRADTNEHGELTRRELQQAFRKRGKKLFSPPNRCGNASSPTRYWTSAIRWPGASRSPTAAGRR